MSLAQNKPVSGKVFGYQVDFPGVSATKRGVTVDREAWEECVGCPEFEGCYRISTGTILMELALTR
jgi:hypothetical protein